MIKVAIFYDCFKIMLYDCLYLYQESKDVVYDQITQSDQLDDKNQSSDEDNDENSENDSNDKLLNDIRETKFDKELAFAIRESNDENDLTNGSELIKDQALRIYLVFRNELLYFSP